jgi:hypothetical protein
LRTPCWAFRVIISVPLERVAVFARFSEAFMNLNLGQQVLTLVILAIPISSIAWTITHEEIFRETRDWCVRNSKTCRTIYERKFFYLFTCEYCFSHYVTAIFLVITRFKLLMPGWRGYLISGFALVGVANIYMSIFARLRLDIKRERVEISAVEKNVNPESSSER